MYSYRYEKEGSTITNCFPEDDETTMWLKSSSNLQEVIEAAKENGLMYNLKIFQLTQFTIINTVSIMICMIILIMWIILY